ncbi:hypothetical protein P5673_012009 [Acropora cervicornis]|uniref:Uncharacterized protein n=1 Tax=Acropora cervicornis TaxID=6130 RepID=A0AAD9V7W9_ACRCE|nr:hypothetical protein P5673_012009 [Acropora cervicornis]
MTTNKDIVTSSGVLTSSRNDHNLIYLLMHLTVPRARPSYMSIRSHKKYGPTKFLEDLQLVPFHMVNYFDYISDQLYMYGILFLDVLNEHALIKRIKIKVKPNPFVSPEIKQLMKTRDNWHRRAMKTNDKLHWNPYKFFTQDVKREIHLAERIYVKSQVINSKGNTNSVWKVINHCLPKESSCLPQFNDSHENMANSFNKYFSSVGSLTALKAGQFVYQPLCK